MELLIGVVGFAGFMICLGAFIHGRQVRKGLG